MNRSGRPALPLLPLIAMVTLAAAPARAQAGEDALGPRPEGPREAPRVAPQPRGEVPSGLDAQPDRLRPSPGRLLAEGAYIHRARGRLLSGDAGLWIFVFDPDADGVTLPPMVLQPCLRLTEMRRLAEGKEQTTTFSVSGQVFAFDGRNYLLPTYFTTVSAEALGLSGEGSVGGADEPPSAPSDPANPSAADLLKELEANSAERSRARAGAGSGAPSLLREGLTIVQRRGRIERGPASSWVFLTDNGPRAGDETSVRQESDVPLRLAPCLILEDIQRVIRERGERQVFRVSGQVFVYEDRNYLIPTAFRLEHDYEGNLTPAQ